MAGFSRIVGVDDACDDYSFLAAGLLAATVLLGCLTALSAGFAADFFWWPPSERMCGATFTVSSAVQPPITVLQAA